MTLFTLSYSSYSLFKESPLQFYFKYVAKAQPTNKASQAYGLAGTAVHKALEDFMINGEFSFDDRWAEMNVDQHHGMSNVKLDKEKYRVMWKNGMKFIHENITSLDKRTEYELVSEAIMPTKVKVILDVAVASNHKISNIFDWKTNSTATRELHLDQRLFYSWFSNAIGLGIPTCTWVYLKNMTVYKETFTLSELDDFQHKLLDMIATVKKYGNDVSSYEPGNWKNPFNEYSDLCAEEVRRRESRAEQNINLVCKGNFVFIEGSNDTLDEGIDFATKFDEKNKWHMQQYARKNLRGKVNIDEIGVVHLYNRRQRCFPIGMLEQVKKIISDYGEYYKKDLNINFIDKRDQAVMNRVCEYPAVELDKYKTLRPYQRDALSAFMKAQTGILHIATGGGKTFIASKIINEVCGKVLWVIDRKELLEQTRTELQNELQMPIGIIQADNIDIQTVTVATIQTLVKNLDIFHAFLNGVNFVIVDEFHKAAAESYQKLFAKLPNTKYRLGLTATPYRDDGKDPILFSVLGNIVYHISTEELIKQGYLVKPEIYFYNVNEPYSGDTYPEDYKVSIIDNEWRNQKIVAYALARKLQGKKVLILTKNVKHGEAIAASLQCSHIHGGTNDDIRKVSYAYFKTNPSCMVMTNSIGAEGLDIPDLDVIINAAANAGDVKSVQIIGRALRTAEGKTSAIYIDFIDCGRYTSEHSQARIKAFEAQGHMVKVI